jgi:nucleoside 2-deoxyribosyltransferase
MKLTGIIHSIGGFHTIRGFAPLAEIAKISKAEDFQRALIPKHKDEIKEYYRKNRDLFFPEVVLSYTLKYNFNAVDSISGTNPITDIVIDKKEFKSNVDDIKFKPLQQEVGKQRVVDITISDEWLKNNKPFSRIDGNHRISAFLEEHEHTPLEEFSAPFCLILFEDNQENLNSKKVIFHNINSKARSLTTEEELKGIISNNGFTDEDLKERFGWNYYQTRILSEKFKDDSLSTLSNLISAFNNVNEELCKNTVLFNLINFLLNNSLIKSDQENLEEIVNSFERINIAFDSRERLKNSKNSAFVISAVGIMLSKKYDLKAYTNWLSKNHISELKEVNAQSLFDIYLKLTESRPTIFVAMPFFSQDEVRSYNSSYDRVVTKINSENPGINLFLNPIMTHKGMTKNLVIDMLSQINSCSIFIADISNSNVNVGYELGYARSKDIPTIIVKRDNDDTDVPFDYEHDARKEYNPLALDTLEDILYTDIKAILLDKGYTFN